MDAIVAGMPTQTPYPTYTPVPTATPKPTYTPAPLPPTPTSPAMSPVLDTVPQELSPTPTTEPAPEPASTPTPEPPKATVHAPAPTPTITPTPTPVPAPGLPRLHNTLNTRWLERNYPALYRQIQGLEWVGDGQTEIETAAIDQLLFMGVDAITNLRAALALPWVVDGISALEYDLLDRLQGLGHEDPAVAADLIGMPFLQHPDTTDLLAVRGMHKLYRKGVPDAFATSPMFADGVTEDETVMLAAAGTLFSNPATAAQVLTPGEAAVEVLDAATALTPDLRVSIIRMGTQPAPGTIEAVQEAVSFAEQVMDLPLPVGQAVL